MKISYLAIVFCLLLAAASGASEYQWYKGSLHMHSLWSDGDAAPEVAIAWYLDHGWDFVCLTDHNVLQQGERFFPISQNRTLREEHVAAIRERFGEKWVEIRESERRAMRLKTMEELRAHFNTPGRFLVMQGEEITTGSGNPHVNGINLVDFIEPSRKNGMTGIIQRYFDAVAAQAAEHGKPMIAQLNHVNFADGVTVEESVGVKGLYFFEVYNGHPAVANWGHEGKGYPPTDRHWDVLLAMNISKDPDYILYGTATDDAHNYHEFHSRNANPGRGWVMVRASKLEPDTLVEALKRGDFYASTGVVINEIRREARALSFDIAAEPGVTYATQFIGTLKGFDASSEEVLDADGNAKPRGSRLYSPTIGQVLKESTDVSPSYTFTGEELYVRARVVSDKPQPNPFKEGDTEMAWVQPAPVK